MWVEPLANMPFKKKTIGMGNRFRDMPEYHSLILAHGIIGSFIFIGLVPFSILIIRYYSHRDSYLAFKLHAWAHVLTLLLSTVVFVLGWFAVGPRRSLTNPHHGIGLAIYVMVIFQTLWGWNVHRAERKRKRRDIPLKVVVCQSIRYRCYSTPKAVLQSNRGSRNSFIAGLAALSLFWGLSRSR